MYHVQYHVDLERDNSARAKRAKAPHRRLAREAKEVAVEAGREQRGRFVDGAVRGGSSCRSLGPGWSGPGPAQGRGHGSPPCAVAAADGQTAEGGSGSQCQMVHA